MKLLTDNSDYEKNIKIAQEMQGDYEKPVIFHCYWNGALSEKHLYSIMSCYYFNVMNNKHKIILWIQNNIPTEYNSKIKNYCEIRTFSLLYERVNTKFIKYGLQFNKKKVTHYSDLVRYLLLYNYGGCWFDLDCLFLRSFDPIFKNYGNEICVYQWSQENYPNNAIYISLTPRCAKLKGIIEFIIERKRGWGFQAADITFDLPVDLLVLPCCWFDPNWIPNNYNICFENFFKSTAIEYNFDNFFPGAFCYHWHNKWHDIIEENSPLQQLATLIMANLDKKINLKPQINH